MAIKCSPVTDLQLKIALKGEFKVLTALFHETDGQSWERCQEILMKDKNWFLNFPQCNLLISFVRFATPGIRDDLGYFLKGLTTLDQRTISKCLL